MHRYSLLAMLLSAVALADERPKVLDERLKLELIAEAPVIRTPTGITIDDKGRVYVIESHTHFPPKDYDGPQTDRILRFEKKEETYESSVFFEGTTHTMGCGFHPDGSLYVATRMEIFKLNDKNDNGKIDDGERKNLIKHDTPGNYPHNGLSGFAFDFAGNVYFGQGENLGAEYKLIGSDGRTITGGGEGGNIYCCDLEGKKLRRVATGFWNPFHLYMDPFGRLFAVDNDPDSRPPCRLLHVVEGGDYGYRFRNGRKGTHPFTSWNGELPGTLPMVSGTGEAPSGIAGYDIHDPLEDLWHRLLVTSWGDHRIEKYTRADRGASFSATMTPIVSGGENFRPVGLVIGADHSIWFSDWVDKSYEVHGKGRLWRLSKDPAKADNKVVRKKYFGDFRALDPALKGATKESIKGLLDSEDDNLANFYPVGQVQYFRVIERGSAADWKLRSAIIRKGTYAPIRAYALGGSIGTPPVLPEDVNVISYTADKQPGEIRYAATRRLKPKEHREHLARLLELVGDPDPFIQQAARWALKPVAEKLGGFGIVQDPAKRLGIALVLREANTEVTRKWLPEMLHDQDARVRFVAIQWIGEERLKDVWQEFKNDVQRSIATRQELEAFLATSAFLSDEKYDPGKEAPGEEFVAKMLLDKKTKPERQAFLLRMLRADHPAITDALLQQWIEGKDAGLRLAALQTISQRPSPPAFLNLGAVSQDDARPIEERLEAIAAMASQPQKYEGILRELMDDKHPLIATQAGRTIRTDERLAAATSIAFGPDGRTPASDIGQWRKIMDQQPGDAKSGQYVFHHAVSQCSRCHEANGRGAAIGPNLTGIGKTMSRERLIQSIFQPSQEIAPQFAVWEIVTTDGKSHKGMYVGEEVDGAVIYANEKGERFKIHPRDVEQRTQQKTSIMPDGLPYRLTDQELRDLRAYLEST